MEKDTFQVSVTFKGEKKFVAVNRTGEQPMRLLRLVLKKRYDWTSPNQTEQIYIMQMSKKREIKPLRKDFNEDQIQSLMRLLYSRAFPLTSNDSFTFQLPS